MKRSPWLTLRVSELVHSFSNSSTLKTCSTNSNHDFIHHDRRFARRRGRTDSALVAGDSIGSCELTFEPHDVVPGEFHFSIGTAGSTALVLQTILPALVIAAGPSTLILEGGTHNPLAPPFDFLAKTFLPLLNQMGPRVAVELERHGFFPAGRAGSA